MSANKSNSSTSSLVSVMPRNIKRRSIVMLAIVAIAVVIGVVGALIMRQPSGGTSLKPAHLLLVDTAKSRLVVTDTDGKQIYQVAYPKDAYPNFEASTPSGQILVSLSIGTTNEGFLFIKDGKSKALNDDTIKALRSAVIVGGSHRIFFAGEDSAYFVACPDTCKLVKLDIPSGKMTDVVNTGVKAAPLAPVYLLGLSGDSETAFLRVIGANKLGKASEAVYKVKIKTSKVENEIKTPPLAGYSLSLSPDGSKLAYQTGGVGQEVEIHTLDAASKKDTSVKWTKDFLGSEPSALVWSPDGNNIFFRSAHINLAPGSGQSPAKDTHLAYLDIGKKAITEVQTVKDQSKVQVTYAGWLDNRTVVYTQDTATTPYVFINPSHQTLKLDVPGKKTSSISVSGSLKQIVRW